jgi:hypothetical protein
MAGADRVRGMQRGIEFEIAQEESAHREVMHPGVEHDDRRGHAVDDRTRECLSRLRSTDGIESRRVVCRAVGGLFVHVSGFCAPMRSCAGPTRASTDPSSNRPCRGQGGLLDPADRLVPSGASQRRADPHALDVTRVPRKDASRRRNRTAWPQAWQPSAPWPTIAAATIRSGPLIRRTLNLPAAGFAGAGIASRSRDAPWAARKLPSRRSRHGYSCQRHQVRGEIAPDAR